MCPVLLGCKNAGQDLGLGYGEIPTISKRQSKGKAQPLNDIYMFVIFAMGSTIVCLPDMMGGGSPRLHSPRAGKLQPPG